MATALKSKEYEWKYAFIVMAGDDRDDGMPIAAFYHRQPAYNFALELDHIYEWVAVEVVKIVETEFDGKPDVVYKRETSRDYYRGE
jgi:hypothetical protein